MARMGLVDAYIGNPRAYLNADWPASDIEKIYGVGLNSSGLIVKGAGQTGIIGVVALTRELLVNSDEPIDIMHDGEVTEFGPTAGTPGTDFGAAGTAYYADPTTGAISSTSAANKVYVGHTVEGSRLIVHVGQKTIQAS